MLDIVWWIERKNCVVNITVTHVRTMVVCGTGSVPTESESPFICSSLFKASNDIIIAVITERKRETKNYRYSFSLRTVCIPNNIKKGQLNIRRHARNSYLKYLTPKIPT